MIYLYAPIGGPTVQRCRSSSRVSLPRDNQYGITQIDALHQSANGRMTLVIADDTEAIPVLWTELDLSSLKKARYALAEREGISSTYVDRSVGVWSPSVSSDRRETATIGEWAASRGVSCVVWTALRPNSMGGPGRPSCDQVVRYLAGLEGESSRLAEEYIRRAPRQIRTPYRPIIERDLGWTPAIST